MSDFINKLDGLLLGDGSLPKGIIHHAYKDNAYHCRYAQGCMHFSWLNAIGHWLLDEGSFGYSIIETKIKGWTKHQSYFIQSQFSFFFKEQRVRWYKEWYPDSNDDTRVIYRKRVPDDIELTPECVANWYMGDGGISKHKFANSYRVGLATDGFTQKEVEYLVYLLNEQVTDGFYLNKHGTKKTGEQSCVIKLSNKQKVRDFIEYVRPHIVPCFNYKIPEVN